MYWELNTISPIRNKEGKITHYLAVKEEHRRTGIANKLLQHIVMYCKGDISIYVQKDDVIIKMFEKFGFESRNIEMRLERKTK